MSFFIVNCDVSKCRNDNLQTIEGELMKALRAVDLVTDAEFLDPTAVSFQRTSRTDKGVSAARQVVNIALSIGKPHF